MSKVFPSFRLDVDPERPNPLSSIVPVDARARRRSVFNRGAMPQEMSLAAIQPVAAGRAADRAGRSVSDFPAPDAINDFVNGPAKVEGLPGHVIVLPVDDLTASAKRFG